MRSVEGLINQRDPACFSGASGCAQSKRAHYPQKRRCGGHHESDGESSSSVSQGAGYAWPHCLSYAKEYGYEA